MHTAKLPCLMYIADYLKSQLKFKILLPIPQFSGCTYVFINKNKEKRKKSRSKIKLKRNAKVIFNGT